MIPYLFKKNTTKYNDLVMDYSERNASIQCGGFISRYYWSRKYDYKQFVQAEPPDGSLDGEWLEELSRVRISIQRRLATKITRSARVSFSSQLANLGKN